MTTTKEQAKKLGIRLTRKVNGKRQPKSTKLLKQQIKNKKKTKKRLVSRFPDDLSKKEKEMLFRKKLREFQGELMKKIKKEAKKGFYPYKVLIHKDELKFVKDSKNKLKKRGFKVKELETARGLMLIVG